MKNKIWQIDNISFLFFFPNDSDLHYCLSLNLGVNFSLHMQTLGQCNEYLLVNAYYILA